MSDNRQTARMARLRALGPLVTELTPADMADAARRQRDVDAAMTRAIDRANPRRFS